MEASLVQLEGTSEISKNSFSDYSKSARFFARITVAPFKSASVVGVLSVRSLIFSARANAIFEAILCPEVQSLCNEGCSEGYEVATNTLKSCTLVSCGVLPKMEHTLHGFLPSTRVPLDIHWTDCVRVCENFPFYAKL